MFTISLPSDERRTQIRAFWLTLTSLTLAAWLAAAWWMHAAGLVVAGVVAAALVGSVAIVREDFTWRVYRAWNRRLVKPFASAASKVVMAICFFVVVIVGRARVRVRDGLPAESRTSWSSRRSLSSAAYHSLFAGAFAEPASGAWVGDYVRWAKRTRNVWATSLLPFLAILKLLSCEEEKASETNIYTLF